MPVKTFRPLTPSTRYITIADYSDITKTKPEKSLVEIRKKTGGRNHYGRVTARGIGGGHKQKIRLVDFKRNKHGVEATVAAIEYDPMRTARLALLQYADGEKRYIIAPAGIKVGVKVSSGPSALPEVGNSLPLKSIPVGISYPQHRIDARSWRTNRRFGAGERSGVDVPRCGLRANPFAVRRNPPHVTKKLLRDDCGGGQYGTRKYYFRQSGTVAASRHSSD